MREVLAYCDLRFRHFLTVNIITLSLNRTIHEEFKSQKSSSRTIELKSQNKNEKSIPLWIKFNFSWLVGFLHPSIFVFEKLRSETWNSNDLASAIVSRFDWLHSPLIRIRCKKRKKVTKRSSANDVFFIHNRFFYYTAYKANKKRYSWFNKKKIVIE